VDRSVLAWTIGHRSPAATTAMKAVSTLGSTSVMALLALLAAALLWRMRRVDIAGVVLGAAAGAGLLLQMFKHLYQ
jgi:undecaprenyl-diphosphatase